MGCWWPWTERRLTLIIISFWVQNCNTDSVVNDLFAWRRGGGGISGPSNTPSRQGPVPPPRSPRKGKRDYSIGAARCPEDPFRTECYGGHSQGQGVYCLGQLTTSVSRFAKHQMLPRAPSYSDITVTVTVLGWALKNTLAAFMMP